jgi:hypothetical protein
MVHRLCEQAAGRHELRMAALEKGEVADEEELDLLGIVDQMSGSAAVSSWGKKSGSGSSSGSGSKAGMKEGASLDADNDESDEEEEDEGQRTFSRPKRRRKGSLANQIPE